MSANTHERHQWLQAICAEEPLTLIARGECMAPLITDGARLQISTKQRYYPGDVIVVCAANGSYRVHRLLGIVRRRVVTRGDQSPQVDRLVGLEDVLGKVSGGECDVRAVRVDLVRRATSFAAFGVYLLGRLLRPGKTGVPGHTQQGK